LAFDWKNYQTPNGFEGEAVMMTPMGGFYINPELGRHQVRLSYVLKKALEKYNNIGIKDDKYIR